MRAEVEEVELAAGLRARAAMAMMRAATTGMATAMSVRAVG